MLHNAFLVHDDIEDESLEADRALVRKSNTGGEFMDDAAIKAMGPQMLAQYEKGKQVVAQSGCLACHRLGDNGNNGPGPELTHIGARLPRNAIARSLQPVDREGGLRVVVAANSFALPTRCRTRYATARTSRSAGAGR